METQKVILPFFYALFMPDLIQEDPSAPLPSSQETEPQGPTGHSTSLYEAEKE